MSVNPFKGIKLQLKGVRKRKSNSTFAPTILNGAFFAKYTRTEPKADINENSYAKAHLQGDILELIRRSDKKNKKREKAVNEHAEDSITHLPKHLFALPNTSLFEKLFSKSNSKPKSAPKPVYEQTLPDFENTFGFCPPLASTPIGSQAQKVAPKRHLPIPRSQIKPKKSTSSEPYQREMVEAFVEEAENLASQKLYSPPPLASQGSQIKSKKTSSETYQRELIEAFELEAQNVDTSWFGVAVPREADTVKSSLQTMIKILNEDTVTDLSLDESTFDTTTLSNLANFTFGPLIEEESFPFDMTIKEHIRDEVETKEAARFGRSFLEKAEDPFFGAGQPMENPLDDSFFGSEKGAFEESQFNLFNF